MWACWKALLLTLSDVTINCNCFNDWDYSLLVPNEVFEPYLTLWIDHYLSIRNHMIKSIYVAVIRMIMMPSCPYFNFIDTSISKHVDIFSISASAWGQARSKLGGVHTSILHHAFISIFIAFWAVITHYISILMAILSYFTRFTMKRRNAGSWNSGWRRRKRWKPILHNSKSPETPRNHFLDLLRIYERKK